MYCSRGICSIFERKRSILIDNEQIGPLQNDDGTYCLDENFCYTCQPINNDACRIILLEQNFPMLKSHKKRSDEDICP
jgi:hypothetical protein